MTLAPDMYMKSDYYSGDERWEVTGRRGFARVNRCTSLGIQEPSLEVYVGGEMRSYHALDDDWGSSFRDSGRHWVRWLRPVRGRFVECRGVARRPAVRNGDLRQQRSRRRGGRARLDRGLAELGSAGVEVPEQRHFGGVVDNLVEHVEGEVDVVRVGVGSPGRAQCDHHRLSPRPTIPSRQAE